MINIISVNEESVNNRIKNILSSLEELRLFTFCDANSALDFVDNNDAFLAIISLDLNANKLDEHFIRHNSNANFIFIYNNLELAISMLNKYDDTFIFRTDDIDSQDFANSIRYLLEQYKYEQFLQDELVQYRDREKKYKYTMNEMSSVLNSRLVCFEHISNIFAKSIAYITSRNKSIDDSILENSFYNIFSNFCKYYFTNEINYHEELEILINSYNIPDKHKFLKFDYNIDVISHKNICDISYYVYVLVHLFVDFLDKYKIKIEVLQDSKLYRIDGLCDARLNKDELDDLNLLYESVQKSISALCDKSEYANRDGIFQFRIYLLKNN